jgi:hypothetical protein
MNNTYRKEIERIKKEFKRMKDNNFTSLAITLPYTIHNDHKKDLLEEAIIEFNNEDDFNVVADYSAIHKFAYKDKSLKKQIKDFIYYDVSLFSIRCEWSIVARKKTKK